MVAEQCREIGIEWQSLILEPEGRNSAPAIALAAHAAVGEDPDAILLVLPSDHLVSDLDGFRSATLEAAGGAAKGGLVTFGVAPDRPETGPSQEESSAGHTQSKTKSSVIQGGTGHDHPTGS